MRNKRNINDIKRQGRFPRRDDLSVKCNNDNPKVKAALGGITRGVLDDPST